MLEYCDKPSNAEYQQLQYMLDKVLDASTYNTPAIAAAMSQLADHFFADKNYFLAGQDYLRALTAWSACEDSKFNIAATENQLGMCLEFVGDATPDSTAKAKFYSEAMSNLEKAYSLLRTVPGDNEQYMVGLLYNKADVLWRQGHWLSAQWVENSEARKLQMQIGACPK
jgi:hypothetical protein